MSAGMDGGGGGMAIGVYGKVRSQPDFLRANAGEFSQAGLDRWFQDAMEIIRTEKTALPPGPTAFVLTPSESGYAFVGAFVPGTDAAGRLFPLSVFATVPAVGLFDELPAMPSAYERFIQAAGAVAMAGAELSGPDVIAHAQALGLDAPAHPTEADARAAVSALGQESAQTLAGVTGASRSSLGYALRTFAMACDQAAKTGPAGSGGVITVDAPAPTAGARTMWLELARRRLKWRDNSPSLLWTVDQTRTLGGFPNPPATDSARQAELRPRGESSRMLMTLGYPAPAALAYLANPRHRAPRFWPLRTEVGAAIEAAVKALTPEQRRLVENPGSSLAELLTAFG